MTSLACLLLTTSLAVPVPDRKEPPKDAEKIQGVWTPTAAESRGTALPAALLQSNRFQLIVDGDQYVFSTHGGKLKLDPTNGTADLTVQNGRNAGRTLPGRYKFDGDTLQLVLPSSITSTVRPAFPMPGQRSAAAVYTFRRNAALTKEKAAALLKERTAALPAAGKGGIPGKGGVGGGGFGGGFGGRATTTQQMLQQIINHLERIERRLDALEQRLPAPGAKK